MTRPLQALAEGIAELRQRKPAVIDLTREQLLGLAAHCKVNNQSSHDIQFKLNSTELLMGLGYYLATDKSATGWLNILTCSEAITRLDQIELTRSLVALRNGRYQGLYKQSELEELTPEQLERRKELVEDLDRALRQATSDLEHLDKKRLKLISFDETVGKSDGEDNSN